jgi:hypothetical protein
VSVAKHAIPDPHEQQCNEDVERERGGEFGSVERPWGVQPVKNKWEQERLSTTRYYQVLLGTTRYY